jgi:hypothetical protein
MRAAVETEGARLRAIVADHSYCFNSSDDLRCDVSGWQDCRGAVAEMRAALSACDVVTERLGSAEMVIASDLGRAESIEQP